MSRITRAPALLLLVALLALPLAACGEREARRVPSRRRGVAPNTTPFLLRAEHRVRLGAVAGARAAARKLSPAAGDVRRPTSTRDVKPRSAPRPTLVALDTGRSTDDVFLGLTQPPTRRSSRRALAKQRAAARLRGGRGLAGDRADRATIDRFKRARNEGSLARQRRYKAATDGAARGALATRLRRRRGPDRASSTGASEDRASARFPGVGRVSWLAGVAEREGAGGFGVRRAPEGRRARGHDLHAELPAQVPTPRLAVHRRQGPRRDARRARSARRRSRSSSGRAKSLGSGCSTTSSALFKGEAAIYVRPLGGKAPSTRSLLKVDDAEKPRARSTSLRRSPAPLPDDVPEPFDDRRRATTRSSSPRRRRSTTRVFDGKVVVTTKPSGIRGRPRPGPLADSPAWKDAAEAAGLPDQTAGIAYADVRRLLPLLETLGVGAKPLPPREADLRFGTDLYGLGRRGRPLGQGLRLRPVAFGPWPSARSSSRRSP